jgi:hypothetical protein
LKAFFYSSAGRSRSLRSACSQYGMGAEMVEPLETTLILADFRQPSSHIEHLAFHEAVPGYTIDDAVADILSGEKLGFIRAVYAVKEGEPTRVFPSLSQIALQRHGLRANSCLMRRASSWIFAGVKCGRLPNETYSHCRLR